MFFSYFVVCFARWGGLLQASSYEASSRRLHRYLDVLLLPLLQLTNNPLEQVDVQTATEAPVRRDNDVVLMRYIESQVYRGAVENFACEMAAKMIAMKSATDNAGEIIDKLQLAYNKARQAAITQEISEIVGGAAAVSG